jgi:phosphatidate phosphatase APP1
MIAAACLLLASACASEPPRGTEVGAGEEVVLFPTAAHIDPTTSSWVVPIHGWIYQRPHGSFWRSAVFRGLLEALDLEEDALAEALFRARAQAFLVGGVEAQRLTVAVAGQQVVTGPSSENGLFDATARVSTKKVQRHARGGQLPVALVGAAGDHEPAQGEVQLIGPRGMAVVSDIDDTVKVSNVREKRALVANTFLKPYEAVPGMAQAYAAWAAQGAAFHYVSSSPWQLYPALAQFFAAAGLPAGSFHLREIGFSNRTVFDLFASPVESKVPTISALVERWPQRQFTLVGDSGEADPEIYAQLYQRYPDRVRHIYIRNVTDEDAQAPRYRTTFAAVPRARWTVFTDPAVLLQPVTVAAAP